MSCQSIHRAMISVRGSLDHARAWLESQALLRGASDCLFFSVACAPEQMNRALCPVLSLSAVVGILE